MPISSTEVSSIIQSQVGMFSASSAYSQAISAQYGYQSMGGMSVADSRSQQGLTAGGIGSTLAQAPGMGLGALSMASMFGMGPAFMDPFSMSFRMGHGAFGARGWAGAIGAGAATFGAYSALGSMGNWATNQMMTGAQNRGMLNATMGGMFPQASSAQLGQLSGMVENAARQGMGSVRELTGIMQAGAGSDQLSMNSIQEFSMSFQRLIGNVRNVANTLKSSLTEAYSAMSSIKGMGIQESDAAGVAGFMRGMGRGVGLSPAQLTGVGTAGANLARQLGIPQATGAMGAMVSAGVYRLADLHNIAPGFRAEDQGRYTQAAFRFLGSRRGRAAVGAMMGPDGEYDPNAGFAISQGLMSAGEMRARHAKLMGTAEGRDLFRSRRSEIAGQFVSEFGPEAIASPLGALSRNQTMSQALTGLNRQDLSALNTLASSGPMLRSQVIEAARSGFSDGAKQVGLGDAISQAIGKITQPIKEKFQQFGASLTQGVQEALDQVTAEFTRGGRGGGAPPNYNFWSGSYQRSRSPFDPSAMAAWDNLPSFGGPGVGQFKPPGSTGAISDFIRGSVPMGLRIGALAPGTSLSELPGYGTGLERYSPGLSAFAASTVGIGPGGRNAWGMVGRGIDRLGAGGMRLFRGAEVGPFGMGGMGPISGTGRLGSTVTRGLGLAMRGGGAILRAASYPILAYDMGTNVVPEMRRRAGLSGISEGAITGNNAQFLQYLSSAGVLGEHGIARHQVGSEGLDYQSAAALGLTPIGGSFQEGESMGGGLSGPGSQAFISDEQLGIANELISEPLTELYSKFGKAKVEEAIKAISGNRSGNNLIGKPHEAHRKVGEILQGASPSEIARVVTHSGVFASSDFSYEDPERVRLSAQGTLLQADTPKGKAAKEAHAAKLAKIKETLGREPGDRVIVGRDRVGPQLKAGTGGGHTFLASLLLGDDAGYGIIRDMTEKAMSGGADAEYQEFIAGQLRGLPVFRDFRRTAAVEKNKTAPSAKDWVRDFFISANTSQTGGKDWAKVAMLPAQQEAHRARTEYQRQWTKIATEEKGYALLTAENAAQESMMPWDNVGEFGFEKGRGGIFPEGPDANWEYGLKDVMEKYGFTKSGQDNRQEAADFFLTNIGHMYEQGTLDKGDMQRTLATLSKAGLKGRELAAAGSRYMRMLGMAEKSGMRVKRWDTDPENTTRRRSGNMGQWLAKLTGNKGITRAAQRDRETRRFFAGKGDITWQAERELVQSANDMLRGMGIADEDQTAQLAAEMVAAVKGGPGSPQHKALMKKVATMRGNPSPQQGGEGGGNLVELSNNVGTALGNLKRYIDNTVGNQTIQ